MMPSPLESLTPTELYRVNKYIDFVYRSQLSDVEIQHTELLKIFISFMEAFVHKKLIEPEVIDERDFRNAVFVRIELAVVTYFHSVKQSLGNFREVIADTLELGYSFEFALAVAGNEREVQLRTSFLDRFFYNVDHFIQNMNREFGFGSDSNTKRKQQVFGEMLKHFGLENSYFTPKQIFDILRKGGNSLNAGFLELLRNNSDRKIKYTDLYEYIANVRNSLHNNGFSNKTLNGLAVGHLKYEMKKDEFLRCVSLPHLLVLLIPLTKILEEVVTKSAGIKPQHLTDPFREEARAFIAERT